jgi:hypothetical protein
VVTYRRLRHLWRPPAETLEAIATVLGEHWRAAARSRTAQLFRSSPASWLQLPTRAPAVAVRLTTSPPAAGSSGTPPGPRR